MLYILAFFCDCKDTYFINWSKHFYAKCVINNQTVVAIDYGDDVPSLLGTPPDPKRRTPPYSPLRGLTFSSNTFSRHDRVSKLPLFIWLNEKVRQTCAVLNGILRGPLPTPLH